MVDDPRHCGQHADDRGIRGQATIFHGDRGRTLARDRKRDESLDLFGTHLQQRRGDAIEQNPHAPELGAQNSTGARRGATGDRSHVIATDDDQLTRRHYQSLAGRCVGDAVVGYHRRQGNWRGALRKQRERALCDP